MMSGDSEVIIKVKGVNKYFSTSSGILEVLKNVNLEVRRKSFLTFIGPSGCGKSTLLSMIGGLVRPSDGEIYIENIKAEGPRPDKIAMVFQDPALLPWRTVMGNVEFGLEIRGIPKKERRDIAQKYIDLVGLSKFEDYFPTQLSGGMRQRVAIARALAVEPEILLMDEPFANLDEQSRLLLGIDLVRIWQRTGKTIVFVTHSIQEAALLSTEIALFTRRPGTIKEVVKIDTGHPRSIEDDNVVKLRKYVWDKLREEIISR
ncbi:MAG: ABC transporter ATP-binding protein [Saccharolobus sp.]|uniref:ABC transporter, ATP-binding protein (Cluster 10, nitrate/sulfonate/bicarbonate) n=1 Tax=Saccharolobus shibatae (strain ATCC 51178 / DSM 5389 / JCM 8931 / NBRC 15437 / B12) TaxID=523848 RepID=A0A8F5BPG5_SACSH|nr:ABC transporter ATP-binding protein [Saccharolobus shibatae]MCH4815794.1 ABC transporter ATP-binding protein [Saccharolobus shibatae]QXJ28959.1 ABC transporter, ATP-binding protein (cluster 10, nitrate/sulfonate/bicarbonate) [Saccharolobus shibatae B12]